MRGEEKGRSREKGAGTNVPEERTAGSMQSLTPGIECVRTAPQKAKEMTVHHSAHLPLASWVEVRYK